MLLVLLIKFSLSLSINYFLPNCGRVILLERRFGGCDWPRPSHMGMGVMLMGSMPVLSGCGSREAELRGSASAREGGNPCLTYSIATASTRSLANAEFCNIIKD